MKKNLTKLTIQRTVYRGAQYPNGGWPRYVLWDSQTKGLGLRIFPTGRKTFILKYRMSGRGRIMTLGDFGSITIQQALAKAAKFQGEIQLNDKDPLEARRKERQAATVAHLCHDYLERHAKVHKRSWKKDASRLDRHVLPQWKSRKVFEITRSDVAQLHQRIGRNAPYEANRTLEILSKMFDLAIDWGYLDEGMQNPARRIPKFPEEKRDRWVKPTELPRLAKAIDAEQNVYIRDALWLYLLTGVRKTELLRAKWEDIDFDSREWRISETKTDQTYYVPLSPEAIKILRHIPQSTGNPYVFPGARRGRHLVNIDKNWQHVRKAAGIPDVRLHDLRRTVGSMLAQSGTSLLIIQKTLNHATIAATQVYARLGQDSVREALESHAKKLMSIAGYRNPK